MSDLIFIVLLFFFKIIGSDTLWLPVNGPLARLAFLDYIFCKLLLVSVESVSCNGDGTETVVVSKAQDKWIRISECDETHHVGSNEEDFTITFECGVGIVSIILSRQNLSSWFPSKRDSKQSPQLQRLARILNFRLCQA